MSLEPTAPNADKAKGICCDSKAIVELWDGDIKLVNKWLARAHPEFVTDNGMTPWGNLLHQLETSGAETPGSASCNRSVQGQGE